MTEFYSPKLSFKDRADEDKPREKLLQQGVRALSNAELLAIILGSGNREETVVELSQRILASAGNNLTALGKYSINQLVSDFRGIGQAKAISIIAALELGKRRKAEEQSVVRVKCSNDIYHVFYPILSDLQVEECWVMLLTRSNTILEKIRVSQGGVSETAVDAKLILKEAVVRLASGLVLCHNHPSGNMYPSTQDDLITKKVKESARLLDITLVDHVIFCESGYYSYVDEGRL